MPINACQLMPVGIAQAGNVEVGAAGGSGSWLAFIPSSRQKAGRMEPSDNLRALSVICTRSDISQHLVPTTLPLVCTDSMPPG